MSSKIEVVEVFFGRTSGASFFSKEFIWPNMGRPGRNSRPNQVQSAVESASIRFRSTKFIPKSSFVQDPEYLPIINDLSSSVNA